MLSDIHGPTPAFQPVMDLCDNDCRGLIHSTHRGVRVVRDQSNGRGPRSPLAKEHARLRRLPRFHFLPQFYAKTWDKCLMPRFRRLPFELLTQEHLPKLLGDVSAALRVLHAHNIVHADVRLDNIMLRPWPPGFSATRAV